MIMIMILTFSAKIVPTGTYLQATSASMGTTDLLYTRFHRNNFIFWVKMTTYVFFFNWKYLHRFSEKKKLILDHNATYHFFFYRKYSHRVSQKTNLYFGWVPNVSPISGLMSEEKWGINLFQKKGQILKIFSFKTGWP